jgi:hypothetical protein
MEGASYQRTGPQNEEERPESKEGKGYECQEIRKQQDEV